MVKFCPKCGSPMVPMKKPDGTIVLKCINPKCGYEMPAPPSVLRKYRMEDKADKKQKVVTTKVISKQEQLNIDKEVMEQLKEEYYELVLDQMGEYGE